MPFLTLLGMPVRAPLNAALAIARAVETAARREFCDPAQIRNELNALEAALDAGEIDEEAFEEVEEGLIRRLGEARKLEGSE